MSALGKTLYPYCKRLRVLDLRDLYHLLDSDHLRRPKLIQWFFSGDMAQFHLIISNTRSGRSALKTSDIVATMGNVIVNETQLLEGLTEAVPGSMLSTKLASWAPNLTNLRKLDFSDARCFADPETRSALLKHCPNISELRMYALTAKDADSQLAAYIETLPANSLRLFETIRDCQIGPETCAAFNRHGQSLRVLRLSLDDIGMLGLAQARACTQLESLSIDGRSLSPGLMTENEDALKEIQDWLSDCSSLREVALTDLVFAPAVLTPMLQKAHVRLHSLSIAASAEALQYDIQDQVDFHTALTQQQELQVLFLKAKSEAASMQDRTILLDVLCSLASLRHLEIRGVSEDFNNAEVQALAQHLHDLETLYVNGYGYTDPVLESLSVLRKLKALTFAGISRFTAGGLLNFITELSKGNQGLSLSLEYVDPDYALSEKEESQVSDALAKTVGGELKYQLWRGMILIERKILQLTIVDPDALDLDSDESD